MHNHVTIPSLATKSSLVQKIPSAQTANDILNFLWDLDYRNPSISQDIVAYDDVLIKTAKSTNKWSLDAKWSEEIAETVQNDQKRW